MSMASLHESGSSRPGSVVPPPPKIRSRAASLSSDRPSTIGLGLMSPPLSVSPEAAFIAGSAASQIVTNDHDSHADVWLIEHGLEPPSETAMVSPGALKLVNNFLDQLLFNFLSVAQSTSLSALRPAVSEVLKPKLAKDAVYQADEELREYLGGGDDEDYRGSQSAVSPRDWDLELVWKRTRLRCMVYSSLGDMEEEEEDFYTERESLGTSDETSSELHVSPAVAIFMTSILEYMAEQTLVVAGQAAYHRMRSTYEKTLKDGSRSPSNFMSRIVVEELDMERVALDRTLGRLWRAWKKRIRSPTFNNNLEHSFSRPFPKDSAVRPPHSRQASLDTALTTLQRMKEEAATRSPEGEQLEGVPEDDKEEQNESEECLKSPASIPLPQGPDDIAEILVAGLASGYYSDDEDDELLHPDVASDLPLRPKSMMFIPLGLAIQGLPTPVSSQPQTPLLPPARKRANSLPTPSTSPYHSPVAKRAKVDVDNQASVPIPSSETPAEPSLAEDDSAAPHSKDEQDDAKLVDELAVDTRPQRKSSAQIAALIAGMVPHIVTGPPARLVDEPEEEIDEFTEEPEIMTSSRVSLSISGRSSSPSTSDRGKPPPLITVAIPKRSGSVHSLRVIELGSPRSPISRSRNSSADALERASLRSSTLSRTDSVSTPPIVEEPRRQISPVRKAFPAGKPTPLYQSDSISEVEEVAGMASSASLATPTTVNVATPVDEPPAARFEDLETHLQSSDAIFGSVHRHASPPHSPARPSPPATKVTILSSSTSNGTFYFDERPEVPNKSPAKKPMPPVLPERHASRQSSASNPSPISPVTVSPVSPAEASSIGVVSIERPSPPRRQPMEPIREQRQTPPRPQEQSPPTRQIHHEPASSISSKYKPAVRSSQESSSRPEDVARSFEELIQSDQTIQYTLTPDSMRDIDSTRGTIKIDSPVLRPKSRKSEDVHHQFSDRARSSSTATTRQIGEIKRSTSISRSTGLSSHPVASETHVNSAKLMGPVPRAPAGMAARRGPGPQAREARIPNESLSDFADFIRATGPPGSVGHTMPGPIPGRVNTAQYQNRNVSGPISAKASMDGRGSTSSSARARLLARDAAVDPRESNSDLIDFIRRGPPSASGGNGGNPRIPRTVAPFRTTMDSDQFATESGGKAVDATIPDIRHSAASTNVTEYSADSSVHSSSALLRREKPLPIRGAPAASYGTRDNDDMMPKRKTRRVRDPYAIDISDEDELDDLMEEPTSRARRQQQQPKEESLAEFLRNVPPPPETSPVPFSVQQRPVPKMPKKKASAPSLISRFTRSKDGNSPTFPGFSSSSRNTHKNTDSISTAAPPPSRGHVPIQINMNRDASVRPATSAAGTLSRSMTANTTASAGGARVRMQKFEPRDAMPMPSRGTSDLAEFFRSSEPPRDFGPVGGFSGQDADLHGRSRGMFSRRKQSGVM